VTRPTTAPARCVSAGVNSYRTAHAIPDAGDDDELNVGRVVGLTTPGWPVQQQTNNFGMVSVPGNSRLNDAISFWSSMDHAAHVRDGPEAGGAHSRQSSASLRGFALARRRWRAFTRSWVRRATPTIATSSAPPIAAKISATPSGS